MGRNISMDCGVRASLVGSLLGDFGFSSGLEHPTGLPLVGALARAVYPALKAAQKDPIDTLAYE
jgi:hypothetical protein